MEFPEERIVFFLDILGFKDIIDSCDENPKLFESIMSIVSDMNEQKAITVKSVSSPPRLEISVISDSIVVSAPYRELVSNDFGRLKYMFNIVSAFMMKSCLNGWLVRGAVSKGWLYHQDNKVFGKGLTKAYIQESKFAIYPRLIIDSDIADSLGDYYLCFQDRDGVYAFDWMLASWGDDTQLKVLGLKIEEMVSGMKYKDLPEAVKEKYYWLADTYNRRVSGDVYKINLD